jgi:hypothetical protein
MCQTRKKRIHRDLEGTCMMDHLVFGVLDLEQGIALVERMTGVRARFGGRHPGRGTHNALLGLGGPQYLEIIARDPDQPAGTPLTFAGLEGLGTPRFVSWAVAVDDIAATAKRAAAAGCTLVGPVDRSRARTDGTLLQWETLTIAEPAIDLVPFFIEWHPETTHPALDSVPGCTLLSFEIAHPEPDRLRQLLAALGVEASVSKGPAATLSARLRTPKGEVTLA